jgi:Cu-Zn family superoxide dismutase
LSEGDGRFDKIGHDFNEEMPMTAKNAALAGLALISLAIATAGHSRGAAGPAAPGASVEINDASGSLRATGTLQQRADGIAVHIQAHGMKPGSYGIHVHAVGQCAGPAFASAGGHWNPTGKQHGRDNPMGMHEGDLPNLVIGSDGNGTLDAVVAGGKLSDGAAALLDADGAAIVIHAAADDYKTDPSGNSGARVACGVVQPA